jgi:protein-tyrosine phosphatase
MVAENKPPLLVPYIPGLKVPGQFYTVAMHPAPIAGMAWPDFSEQTWSAIYQQGIRHVICLADAKPNYTCEPVGLTIAHAVELEDQLGRPAPSDPAREDRLIRAAVRIAAEIVRVKEGLVMHCVGGTGRTGTVLGCLLCELGCDGASVVSYLDNLNKARGKHGWPESPWQKAYVLNYRRGG